MERYIHLFETEAEFNAARQNNYLEPWVSYTEESDRVDYNKPDYTKIPFTIVALGTGNISWHLETKTVQYSKNGSAWETMTSATTIPVVNGDEVAFKGTNEAYAWYNDGIVTYSPKSTTQCNVKGNIMSLIAGDNFLTADTITSEYAFGRFFLDTSEWVSLPVVSARELKLPASTLSQSCYESMFANCTTLTTPPEDLPAQTLVDYCYKQMFRGCTAMTYGPKIKATTLGYYCYDSMFSGCTGLTTAPELPVTTLTNGCYWGMFRGCTSLIKAPDLPAVTATNSCYASMFRDCTSLTTAPKLSATTLAGQCYESMFRGCTSLTTVPNLPATTLASYCYNQMFRDCSKLSYIKAMFTTAPGYSYTSSWVDGVAASGTFVKNSAATWTTTGVNGVPTGWTVETASA